MSEQAQNAAAPVKNDSIPEEIRPPKPNLDLVRKLEFNDEFISRLENLPDDDLAKQGSMKGVSYSIEKKNLAAEFFESGKFQSKKEIAAAVGMKSEANVRSALKFYVSSKNKDNQKQNVLEAVSKERSKYHRKIDLNSIPEHVAVMEELKEAKARIRELEIQVVRAEAKAEAFIEFHQKQA